MEEHALFKKILSVILAATLLAAYALARAEPEIPCDYRHSHWNDTEAQVYAAEGEPVFDGFYNDDTPLLVYENTVVGLEAQLRYLFENGGLSRVHVNFTQAHDALSEGL